MTRLGRQSVRMHWRRLSNDGGRLGAGLMPGAVRRRAVGAIAARRRRVLPVVTVGVLAGRRTLRMGLTLPRRHLSGGQDGGLQECQDKE